MDRLAYRVMAAARRSGGDGAFDLVRRLAEAGELADGWILSVDHPSAALTRLLERDCAARSFCFPARSARPLLREPAPVFLADRDSDAEASGTDVGGGPSRLRFRRIDGLFAHRKKRFALLHVNDGRFSAAVLAGASTLLGRDRPWLLVGVIAADGDARLAEAHEVAAVMQSHGYRLLDGTLLPVETAEARREAVLVGGQTSFLGVPGETEATVRRLLGSSLDLPRSLTGEELLAAALLRRAALPPVAGAGGMPISFDESLVCDGFYPPERAGDRVWRWSGPFPEARLYLPLPRAARYRLDLGIIDLGRPAQIEALRLYFDGGVLVKRMRRQRWGWTVEVDFTVPVGSCKGWGELLLAYGATAEANAREPRRLGLCIGSGHLQEMDV